MNGAVVKRFEIKRRYKRAPLFRDVEYGEARKFWGHMTEISEGGMFIDTLITFIPGTIIRARFQLRDFEEPIVVTAEVLYAQRGIGMGVKFLDLKPKDRERIRQFVERFPSLPARERPRRSPRILVNLPVTIKGSGTDGASFERQATIVALSKNGACVLAMDMDLNLDVGSRLLLQTPRGVEVKANVAWLGNKLSETAGQIGIQCRGLAQALGFDFP